MNNTPNKVSIEELEKIWQTKEEVNEAQADAAYEKQEQQKLEEASERFWCGVRGAFNE